MISKTTLLLLALRARGYSQCTHDMDASGRYHFRISPTHLRRVANYSDLWFEHAGAVRGGRNWQLGKPLPRATIANLIDEGRGIHRARQQQPITIEGLGL